MRGFTLVEMLVVIAVVVLLASIVLIGFHAARLKANNAAIRKDADQMRTVAEGIFNDNGDAGYCVVGARCAATDPDITLLRQDVDEKNGRAGGQPTVVAGPTFCVESVLADGATYCTDSNYAYTGTAVGNGTGRCIGGLCQ